ncbi:hypothetical protein CH330_07120 [candidate division WOR-3 bacterium JGI_Cruoil_03_51_56]|uniref:Secretion system C-terminal sorting domain-containing protein n=1 Tax=candidate division WOR-3 bacterium JGI_Cruoil_03_51_56 TaxID=1973747 RepID=A0A235BSF6_UNCW3|nr:MAG: hypothetical protein CH330_07120 [candidate division WOR-3 bacterium JGI_Cruoil_03_51_56]
MLIGILAVAVSASLALGPFEVTLRSSEFTFERENGFIRIKPQSSPVHQNPGHPELPVKYLRYIIPRDMKPDSLSVLELETRNLPGSSVYQIGWTDGNGKVVFEVLAESPGIIKVTCVHSREASESYAQYLPSQTECEVVPTGQGPGGQGEVVEIPLTLECNSSNPAHGAVAFICGIPKSGRVSVLVFDAAGKKVAELFDGELAQGWHRLVWNAEKKVAAGSYWVVLRANGENHTRKLVIGR